MSIEAWILPSLFSLLVWGVSAFTPKLAVSLPPMQVLVYQGIGSGFFAFLLFAVQGFSISYDFRGAVFGVAIGVLGMTGQLFYVTALKRGPVGSVSILSSLYPVIVILLAFSLLGEEISGRQAAGVVMAISALIILVSQKNADGTRKGKGWIAPAIAAMLLWSGWAFVPKLALQTLPPTSVLIYEAIGNGLVALALYSVMGFKLKKSREGLKFCTLTSFLGMSAILAYLYALSHGPVSIVAVITALYPVITILLARIILKEKMSTAQKVSVGVALAAIGLMVA